ncbi:immunoglobulin superfamily member 6 [Cebidichthys violaceus]|uniref:immunoglobulin superfamily member 6 n=1 Tax=Cebidichthys violaceus TaxID=271503 RepID=UPI0035CB0F21
MDRLVWFSLLLSYLPVTESMKKDESCLTQPNKMMWRKTGQSALLKCIVSSHCSGLHYEWFTFKENFHLRLDLSRDSLKYSLDGASLNIKSLHVNDSGVYHCAAVSRGDPAPGAQHVGLGATLVVQEQNKTMRHILWVSFVLLAIYSMVVVALMIKKCGCNMSVCRSVHKTGKKNSIKKAQFRDVLQEMYRKRNLDKGKKTVSRNRPQAEAASAEFKTSTDDIYQNV